MKREICAPEVPASQMVLTIITDEQLEAFADAVITKYQQTIVRHKAAEKPQEEWMTRKEVMTSLGNKLDVLSGRRVVAYPDVDAYDFWCEHLAIYSNIKVSDYLQHIAGDNLSSCHMDLADLILESLQHHDTSLNPTFQQIKRYISPDYHDELKALIKDLDLDFLGVEKVELT